jgi:fucose 4-O-acetylase-like acetyltransferase
MTEKKKTPVRIAWMDWAKVIGIILVVYAHVPNAPLSSIVFLFHMPFFFMISGWLYKTRPFKEEWRRTCRCLILPYLIYNAVLLIITPPIRL